MNDIKVSVCMVTYNHDRYIAQAVKSVLAQRTTFPIELVIGEDCSTDRTPDILRELAAQNPEKIRLHLGERNRGGKQNFMHTFAACRGQYIAMLEGDDYWICTDKLQLQVDAFDSHPDWAICFHPTTCVYEDGLQGQAIYPLDWDKAEATIEDLFTANFIPTNSVVFRRGLFGSLPLWFGELILGDWPLHILNAAHGNIGFLPALMSAYRIHRGGIWTSTTPAAKIAAIFKMFSVIDHHFSGKYAASIERYRMSTVGELTVEIEALKQNIVTVVDQLRNLQQEESVVADGLTVQNYLHQFATELAALESRHQALSEENRMLRDFHATWSNSISYKVYRETRRPFTKLLQYLRPRPAAIDEPKRQNSQVDSKAA